MKNPLSIILGLLLGISVSIQPVTAADTYGPTTAQETLWSIASRLRPTYAVSTQQMMLAIYAKNPQAFTAANINALKKGSVLKLPTLADIQQLDQSQALHNARQQNHYWQARQQNTQTKGLQKTTKPKATHVNTHVVNTAQQRLKREVASLKAQLKQEQQRSAQLSAKIRELQTKTTNATTTPAELEALRTQVTEMKAVLAEKDTHIKKLQASLKQASESIKRQYAENQALYAKLKSTDPASTPPLPQATHHQPQLTLAEVPAEMPATHNTANSPAVFTDQVVEATLTPATESTPETATESDPESSTPLSDLLVQQANSVGTQPNATVTTDATTSPDARSKTTANTLVPLRLSFIIALISLLIILALLWRAFSQQRSLSKKTANRTITEPVLDEKLETDTNPPSNG